VKFITVILALIAFFDIMSFISKTRKDFSDKAFFAGCIAIIVFDIIYWIIK
jgi:hypothetical protein